MGFKSINHVINSFKIANLKLFVYSVSKGFSSLKCPMGLATVRRDKKKLEVRNGISERSYNDRKTSFYVIRYEEIERTSFNKIF